MISDVAVTESHNLNDWECLPMQFLNKTQPKTWFIYNNELFMLDVVMRESAWAYDKDGRRQFFNASMAITPVRFVVKQGEEK